MDTQELCLKIEQATKSLTPLSVTPVYEDERIATVRIVAEAFAGMKLPTRITEVLAKLDAFDCSLLRTFDLTFELLAPAESEAWGVGSGRESQTAAEDKDKVAARDLGL